MQSQSTLCRIESKPQKFHSKVGSHDYRSHNSRIYAKKHNPSEQIGFPKHQMS
jgi:hypothetical protein